MVKKLIKCIYDKKYRYEVKNKLGFYKNMSDEQFLGKWFKIQIGNDLNLSNPVTYQEKMQWLKLYDRKKIYTIMADKIRMKDFVSERIGDEYVVPIINQWNSPKEIDFSELPPPLPP
jgi:hypothetical protein